MKKNKIIYWVSKGIIAAMMLFSAFGYFTSPDMDAAFKHLGFPAYFRIELAVLKIIGVIVLLVPMLPEKVKVIAYFGFAITFVSAMIAHLSSGDPLSVAMVPIVLLLILGISYYFNEQLKTKR